MNIQTILNRILYTILLIIFSYSAQGQSFYEQKKLDRQRWNEYKEKYNYSKKESRDYSGYLERYFSDKDYGSSKGERNYKYNEGKPLNSKQQTSKTTPRSPSNFSFDGLGVVGYIFLGIVAVAIIIAIIYLIKNSSRAKNEKVIPKTTIEEEINPLEISKTELQLKIEKYIANKEYRKAIRLYFVFTLKTLSEKDWIAWEKEKTNLAYLTEMYGKNEYAPFKDATHIFEYTWYGKINVTEEQFKSVEPIYRKLIQKLNPEAL